MREFLRKKPKLLLNILAFAVLSFARHGKEKRGSQKVQSVEEKDTISLVLIRERSFGKERGNNNLGLILLLLAKYHPSPLCMRSLVWLFSKLIAEVPGLYALLTCSDKPAASFGAKRDFLSQVSSSDLVSPSSAERGTVCSPRLLGKVCQTSSQGLLWE